MSTPIIERPAPPITETAVSGVCDCCGFRAYVRVSFIGKQESRERSLWFCAHHYTQHQEHISGSFRVTNIDDARADELGPR